MRGSKYLLLDKGIYKKCNFAFSPASFYAKYSFSAKWQPFKQEAVCKISYSNMSHPLLTLLFSLSVKCSCLFDACLRQGWLGVLSWKRAVNKEYLEEKQLLTS